MDRNTLRNWGLVLALVLFSGVASVTVPWLSGQFGGGAGGGATVDRGPVVISLPEALANILPSSMVSGTELTLQPILAFLVLAVVVIGGVAVGGGVLAFLLTRLDRAVTSTVQTDAYQKGTAAVAEVEKQRIEALRQKASAPKPVPSHVLPRWSVASTSLIFVIFSVFAGTLVSDTLYPDRRMALGGSFVDPHGIFILGAVIVAVLVLALVFRPRSLAAGRQDADDVTAGIPWDTVYVIITGMIFIAIGVGLVLWLRSAPLLQ